MIELRRIDGDPTHTYGEYKLRAGAVYPFGASLVPGGINFSIFSRYASLCTLVLFEKGSPEPMVEIPFYDQFRIGNVYAMTVFDLNFENIEYGYRFDGPFEPSIGHRFDNSKVLMDPYARLISGRDIWGEEPDWNDPYQYRACPVLNDFDWENDKPLELPIESLVIYEMHVRGFTRHPSSKVKNPGTFDGLREKIPYLKALGVNAVELMPIFEFDEWEHSHINEETGDHLMNYWGYSPVGFFSPKAGYAATGKMGMQVDELKHLVKELHSGGIEVILDVVFNHTAEGNEKGPYISFRGIDNKIYYMLTPDGYYYNFSGTGNTLKCDHPVVRNMVLDALRYWAAEYHIDGFRFDLASILGRDQDGTPLSDPPLLENLAHDPILAKCKLIAEAWDAGGLYQVGTFPAYGRWAEWNGKYRDDVRRFIKSDEGMVGQIAQRLQGSPDLYLSRGPTASINFITCHDGFTMMDMVSYNEKHNHANGEGNRDGANDNHSWNCGIEGQTDNPDVKALRLRQIKNAVTILMMSQGVPMIFMGDEIGRSKNGNNNTYCHDNELTWLDWGLLEENTELLNFFQKVIAFRRAHPVLRNRTYMRNRDYVGSGYADITWHGKEAWNADWSDGSRTLAFMLCGKHAQGGTSPDDYIYVAMNMHWETEWFSLPGLQPPMKWYVAINSGMPVGQDIYPLGEEPLLDHQEGIILSARSVMVLVGR